MNLLAAGADNGAAGLVVIAIVIGICWAISEANKPKGFDIEHRGKTTVRPK